MASRDEGARRRRGIRSMTWLSPGDIRPSQTHGSHVEPPTPVLDEYHRKPMTRRVMRAEPQIRTSPSPDTHERTQMTARLLATRPTGCALRIAGTSG